MQKIANGSLRYIFSDAGYSSTQNAIYVALYDVVTSDPADGLGRLYVLYVHCKVNGETIAFHEAGTVETRALAVRWALARFDYYMGGGEPAPPQQALRAAVLVGQKYEAALSGLVLASQALIRTIETSYPKVFDESLEVSELIDSLGTNAKTAIQALTWKLPECES